MPALAIAPVGLSRLPGWERFLSAYIEQARERPYVLGTWDCAIFAAGAVEAVTGVCPKQLAGLYRSRISALRLIARHGGSLAAAVTGALGVAPIAPLRAGRGDVLLRTEDGAEHLGVCLGPNVATLNQAGLQFPRLGAFDLAWRIG